jgi:hypothetical protein
MKRFATLSNVLTLTLIVAAVLALMPSPALAQAVGETEIRVVIPPVIGLTYFSLMEITLSDTDIGLNATQAFDAGTATLTTAGWSADAAITAQTPTLGTLTNGTVTIENAWGWWATGGNRNLRATVTQGAAAALTLENAGGGTMALSNFRIQTGAAGWGASITWSKTGGATSGRGDLSFDLDLSGAVSDGLYSDSANGPQFTISLTYI